MASPDPSVFRGSDQIRLFENFDVFQNGMSTEARNDGTKLGDGEAVGPGEGVEKRTTV